MKILLILFLNGYLVLTSYTQNCFSYDNAGNRIKRQICIFAISPEENEYLQGLSSISYKGNSAGWNSEGIRHLAQNKFAHKIVKPQPWFRHMGGRGSFFGGSISNNPYSLWWF